MNLRRGLLRVWILASSLWVLGAALRNWTELSEIFVAVEAPKWQVGDKYDYLREMVPEAFMDQSGPPVAALSAGQYACLVTRANRTANDSSPDIQTVEDAWWQCVTYKMHIPMVALAPPITMLVFGYAVAWVMCGFKKPEENPG